MAKKGENSLNNRKTYEQPKSSEIVGFAIRKSPYTGLVADTLNNSRDVSLFKNEYNIGLGKRITIERDGLKIGNEPIAVWNIYNDNDDYDDYEVSVKFNGRDITTGYMLNEAGNITFTVRNKKSGKEITKSMKINKDSSTEIFEPEINLSHAEKVRIEGNKLKMGDKVLASWGEDYKAYIHFIPNYRSVFIRERHELINPSFENHLNEEGIIKITTVRKEDVGEYNGSDSSETIRVNVINAPKINIEKDLINIPSGERKFFIEGNELKIGNQVVASWNENDGNDSIHLQYCLDDFLSSNHTFNLNDLNFKSKKERTRDKELFNDGGLIISLINKDGLKTTKTVDCFVERYDKGYAEYDDTSDEEGKYNSVGSVNNKRDNNLEIIGFNPEKDK